jgi:hypothetical protein
MVPIARRMDCLLASHTALVETSIIITMNPWGLLKVTNFRRPAPAEMGGYISASIGAREPLPDMLGAWQDVPAQRCKHAPPKT